MVIINGLNSRPCKYCAPLLYALGRLRLRPKQYLYIYIRVQAKFLYVESLFLVNNINYLQAMFHEMFHSIKLIDIMHK